MNDIDMIKDRIKKRKHEDCVKADKTFNRFYMFMIKFMLLLIMVIAGGTYIKTSPNYDDIYSFLSRIVSTKDLSEYIDNFLYKTEDVEVSNALNYSHIEGNYYTNHSNECVSLMNGIVIECGDKPILGKYIIVMEDDIKVTYGCLEQIFVSQYDEVDMSMVIGTYNDKVMMIFNEGDKEIDYSSFEEYLDSN